MKIIYMEMRDLKVIKQGKGGLIAGGRRRKEQELQEGWPHSTRPTEGIGTKLEGSSHRRFISDERRETEIF